MKVLPILPFSGQIVNFRHNAGPILLEAGQLSDKHHRKNQSPSAKSRLFGCHSGGRRWRKDPSSQNYIGDVKLFFQRNTD